MINNNWHLFKPSSSLYDCLRAAEKMQFNQFKIKHPTEERVLLGFRFDSAPESIFWRLEGGRNKPFEMRRPY